MFLQKYYVCVILWPVCLFSNNSREFKILYRSSRCYNSRTSLTTISPSTSLNSSTLRCFSHVDSNSWSWYETSILVSTLRRYELLCLWGRMCPLSDAIFFVLFNFEYLLFTLDHLCVGLHPVYKTTVKQLLILLYNITNNATLNKTPLEKLIPIFGPIFLRPRKIMTYMQHDEPLVAKVLTELVLEHERLLPVSAFVLSLSQSKLSLFWVCWCLQSEDKSKTTTTSPTKSTLHLPSSPTAEQKQPSIQHSTNNTFQSDIIQLHNPNLFHTIQSKTKKFYTIDEILTQQKTNQSDKNHTTNNQTKNTSSSHNEKEKEKTNDQETPSLSTSFTTLQKSEPNINDSTFEGVKREDEENQINLNSTLSSSLENANLSSLNSQQEEKEIVIGEGDDETVVVHLTEDDTNMAISDSDQISLISSPLSPKASPLSKEELITQNNDQVQESIQQPTHNNVFHTPPPAIVLNNEVPNQTSSSNTLSDNVQ